MKYLIFLLIASFIGCATIKKYPSNKEFVTYGFDFRQYADSGFLFTPLNLTDRPYDGRGIIKIVGYPQVLARTVRAASGDRNWDQELFIETPLLPDEIIKQAYQIAKSFGADAIISFDLKSIKSSRGNVEVNGLELTGFAIKRK